MQNQKIMTLTSQTNHKYFSLIILLAFILFLPQAGNAQEARSLSVSPTLFTMSANPGQTWQSSLRIINSNSFDLNLYVEVVNFAPEGESGQGRFISFDATDEVKDSFAEWVELSAPSITISPEQTAEVPFTITVPEDAPPGGHSIALLVGTQPLQSNEGVSSVETSQIISSLVFLRVTGDINESGSIRDFKSNSFFVERPETTFTLRFENTGNVHLRPQGEIKIFNMWGQERGVIPINRESLFGNVLPQSIRAYTFGWKSEWAPANIGRYRAVATVAYGEDSRQFASYETSFWIIPWKVILSILVIIGSFVALFVWAIKAYIRRMLYLAQPSLEVASVPKKISVVAPIEVGILDLRSRLRVERTTSGRLQTISNFVAQYRVFFIVTVALCVFIVLVLWFIQSVSSEHREYQVTTDVTETL